MSNIPYCPPETIKKESKSFNEKNDVFSFGVLMCEFLFDEFPFELKKNNPTKIKE